MKNETSKKRGRPAGSNSFTKVKLADLICLVGEGAVVPVSKIWLRENSVDISPASVKVINEAKEEQPQIEYSMTSFDD
jgi:hypothetical protein